MFNKMRHLSKTAQKVLELCDPFCRRNTIFQQVFPMVQCDLCSKYSGLNVREFHTNTPRMKIDDRKHMAASMPKKDDGTEGETSIDIDSLIISKDDMFPTVDLPHKLFQGVPFKDLPIVNIKASKNNTILSCTDAKGLVRFTRSCGVEGFKTARKGTNIAAQATAISFSTRLVDMGLRTIRVRVQGLGPGRISAIKGLQMGGMNVISITDNTHISWNPPRPRKQRRL